MSQQAWAQSALQLITLLRAGHGKVSATTFIYGQGLRELLRVFTSVCGGHTTAASSTDDIPTQLAALFGHPIKRIRITDEEPPRIAVIDLPTAITKKDADQAAQDIGYVQNRRPEVTQILGDFKLRGQGQKKTPVTDLRGVEELTFLLPGRRAAHVRRQEAELL